MSERIIFGFEGNHLLTESLAGKLACGKGEFITRHFPDGETYVKVLSDVKKKDVLIVSTLDRPDNKLLPLYFLAKTIRELGARRVTLIAPYLSYMRQDRRFQPGEAVTSVYFAQLVSLFADSLITIDPHLHRRHSLSEIYSIPCIVLHAAPVIAKFIREQIRRPFLIGPDEESAQWISGIAGETGIPYLVLQKERIGDNQVKVSIPGIQEYEGYTPVLVDDIISTGQTMIETIRHLSDKQTQPPVCIGIHAVFSGNAYETLKSAGAGSIITCNTIAHPSNGIDISELIGQALK